MCSGRCWIRFDTKFGRLGQTHTVIEGNLLKRHCFTTCGNLLPPLRAVGGQGGVKPSRGEIELCGKPMQRHPSPLPLQRREHITASVEMRD